WPKRLDLSAADDNRLILDGHRTGAVDDAYSSQCDHRRFSADELLAFGSLSQGGDRKREEQENRDCWSHGVEDNRIHVICVAMTASFVIAVAVLIGLVLFLWQQVRRPNRTRSLWPKRIRIGLIAVVLFGASLVFWGFFIEPNRLVIRQETIQVAQWPPQLNDFRIAVISDLHAGGEFINEQKLRTIVQRTNALQPELIVILGDFISGDGRRHPLRMTPEVF